MYFSFLRTGKKWVDLGNSIGSSFSWHRSVSAPELARLRWHQLEGICHLMLRQSITHYCLTRENTWCVVWIELFLLLLLFHSIIYSIKTLTSCLYIFTKMKMFYKHVFFNRTNGLSYVLKTSFLSGQTLHTRKKCSTNLTIVTFSPLERG